MATPHIEAAPGQIAETVVMPGDPLRAKFVAENYLQSSTCVNRTRNMLAFTGDYQGKPLTVMGGGMGMPSMSIYATELCRAYGVQNIIRVGSCGSIHEEVNLGDLVVAMGASTDSSINRVRFRGYDYAAICNYDLMRNWIDKAQAQSVNYRVANVFTTDTFYHADESIYEVAASLGIVAVEMETAALYRIAAEEGIRALALLTVSDQILKQQRMSTAERETSFTQMIEITLDSLDQAS